MRIGDANHYSTRGASTSKPDVAAAIKEIDPGLFPDAFCKAVPDYLTGSREHCFFLHADGVGSKSIIAYLRYRRRGDPNVFKFLAQDSLVMNIDDLLCVGATGPFVFSNTIGRNSKIIPGDVLRAIILGYEEFADHIRPFGIDVISCGGETADIGDLVRTMVIDSTVCVRMRRADVIDCSRVKPGHVVVGLSSTGQASYEINDNSGIGTNGFTTLRHGILKRQLMTNHQEIFAPEIAEFAYQGRFDIDDLLPGTSVDIGSACLAPTRTYAPIIKSVLSEYRREISALFHNTGGGLTKCLKFGTNVRYVKDNLFDLPPIFAVIANETEIPARDMAQIFNLGHRFEVVCNPKVADDIVKISEQYRVAAKVVGHIEPSHGRSLVIKCFGESLEYLPE